MLKTLKKKGMNKSYILPLMYYYDFYYLIKSTHNQKEKLQLKKILKLQYYSVVVAMVGVLFLLLIAKIFAWI